MGSKLEKVCQKLAASLALLSVYSIPVRQDKSSTFEELKPFSVLNEEKTSINLRFNNSHRVMEDNRCLKAFRNVSEHKWVSFAI